MALSGRTRGLQVVLSVIALVGTAVSGAGTERSVRQRDQAFTTQAATLPGSHLPARKVFPTIVAVGDISPPRIGAQLATSRLALRLAPTRVLTLGDEQYERGAYADFRAFYDPTWGRLKARTLPAPGNHEYNTPGAAGYFRYFGRTAHPLGHSYYSADLGGWHLVSLDSNIDRTTRSAQLRWLRADLAANTKRCVVAYWHHPRFTSGNAHGDSYSVTPFWTALYHARADLILNGHEHTYERFGRLSPGGRAVRAGIREFVVGTGGDSHYGFGRPQPHSQKRIAGRYGVLRLVLRPRSYLWQFIAVGGRVLDTGAPVACQ